MTGRGPNTGASSASPWRNRRGEAVELLQGEQLSRIHRFRLLKAQGCGLSGIDLLVEEAVGAVLPGHARCTARPEHAELVPKPEFTTAGETVEEALANCIAAIRPRRFYELFLPRV
jgi:hypothetical protein